MTIKIERLVKAIQAVTEHYDWPEGDRRDPVVALMGTREDVDVNEVNRWYADGDITEELLEDYHQVLNAQREDLSIAIHALI